MTPAITAAVISMESPAASMKSPIEAIPFTHLRILLELIGRPQKNRNDITSIRNKAIFYRITVLAIQESKA